MMIRKTNKFKIIQTALLALNFILAGALAFPTAAQSTDGTAAAQTTGTETAGTAVPQTTPASADNGSDVLCLPDAYQITPDACNPSGASEYLTDLAEKGMTWPAAPFPGKKLDDTLSQVSYKYAKLNIEQNETAGYYSSALEASQGINKISEISSGGLRYVSYTERTDIDNAHFVKAKNGLWLRASPAEVSTTMLGRTFTSTPTVSFGYVTETGHPYLDASFGKGQAVSTYNREEILNYYDTVTDSQTTWYKIGENEWFNRNNFHPAMVNTTPPQGIDVGKWIEVDLYNQILMAYDNYQLVYVDLIASGMKPFYTQPGIFKIYQKKDTEDMTGAFEADKSDYYYLEDVPFTMYFDQGRAFHGAYWRAWYGIPQSHGCINMSIGDAHWLYNFANEGDYAYIHDPSGETPTDPSFYGAGGA